MLCHKDGGVIFDLNAESFAGRTLVVFERLYLLNGESSFLVADHEDILDECTCILGSASYSSQCHGFSVPFQHLRCGSWFFHPVQGCLCMEGMPSGFQSD